MKKYAFNIVTVFLFLLGLNLAAQPGPFTYRPPEGVIKWADTTGVEHKYIPIPMDSLGEIPLYYDGIMLSFHVNLDLNDVNKPLVAFALGGEDPEHNLLEVIYSKRTVTVRRYKNFTNPIRRVHYDYHLFDPLFEYNKIATSQKWRIQVYFTSEFMYFVASAVGNEILNLMSPLYFGLDDTNRFPHGNANMYAFLRHYQTAIVKFGDQNLAFPSYVSDVTINTFLYSDFSKTVQREFSSPNPATGI